MEWREKILLIKAEAVYGTDAIPTGAANAILATDVKFNPMKGTEVDRDLDLPYFGASGTIPTGFHATISFKIEAKGSGAAGTPPACGPILRACKQAEVIVAATSVTYNPHSGTPESVSIHFNVAGILYKILGARGNFRYSVNAQGIVYFEFELTGLFVPPSTAALPTPVFGTQLTQFPQAANSANTPTFTVGGVALALSSFSYDAANEVKPRFLIGSESILIRGKSESINMTVDAVPLASINPYALAAAATSQAISLVHGTGAGKICTLSVPAAQLMLPEALDQQDGVVVWKLKATPKPVIRDDQATLAFT